MAAFVLKALAFRGLNAVKQKIQNISAATATIFAKRRVETFLLNKARSRFEPAGTNPYAQRSPSGRFWKPVAQATIPKRVNKNRRQALYNRGTLQDSLMIVRGNLFDVIKNREAAAIIGIRPGAANRRGVLLSTVGAVMQAGGDTPGGRPIPARVFLGVARTDVAEIEAIMERALAKGLK